MNIFRHVLYIQVVDMLTSVDPRINTSTATLSIIIADVNDNAPQIPGTYVTSVSEDAGLNTLVFHINATDADAGANGQLMYNITAGNINETFNIDSYGNVQVCSRFSVNLLFSPLNKNLRI